MREKPGSSKPLSLEDGRYEVNASLMLEGGRSAAVQDADDEPVAGLFWGLKHPPFSNKAAEEAIWFHDEEGGFKGIDANRAELKDLVSKVTSGISHVPEAIARVAVALGMSVAKSTYLQLKVFSDHRRPSRRKVSSTCQLISSITCWDRPETS